MNTQTRAKTGGEFGANGEWYEGGKFLNTIPENAKKEAAARKRASRKQEIESYVWAVAPQPDFVAIFPMLAGVEIFDRATMKFRLNPDLCGTMATPEAIARRQARIDAWNGGERWML